MLRLAKEKKALTITTEQTGAPTNANDLAEVIVQIIKQKSAAYGIYHFSNQGSATWYDFAKAIFETTGEIETINLAKTNHYPTFARRPRYSILNCTKIYKMLKIQPRKWKTSLEGLIRITTQP
jgi:dTDP-4-dehydrorhamnose reductase